MIRFLLLLMTLVAATAAAPFDPFAEARIDEHPGAQVPLDRPVIDQDDLRTTLARMSAGKPILLIPVLHDCPNLCGLTLDGLADAMKASHVVGGRDAAVIAFGIDPKESAADARASLDRLAGRHPEIAGHIHATIADTATVHAVTDPIGYHFAYDPRIGQYAHAAAVAVLTPDGRFSRWLYGLSPDPADLTAALGAARVGKTGGFFHQLILLCYHYDPETGRYGVAIAWLIRVACIATVLAILLYVVLTRRREGAGEC
ncbi:SCO family protein [Hephaestia sp. GCM10023244]|uniref:SCO family protein n=1 Tax=unclassified Hephaestia TaxID=2631281 RepID=UPI002076F940|nr:SCO family protein [Hephaestia sp. MAHUQ-44]MCM8732367.1 SCO family protein [Hephaestia sp. MAHUQ-44]